MPIGQPSNGSSDQPNGMPPEMSNGNQNGQPPNGSSDQSNGMPPEMPNGNQSDQPPNGSNGMPNGQPPSGTSSDTPNGNPNGQPPNGSSNDGNNVYPNGQPPNGNGVSNDGDEEIPEDFENYIKNGSTKLNNFVYMTLMILFVIIA